MFCRLVSVLLLFCALPALADTTILGPHRFEIDAGVTFNVDNASSDDFVFSWSDASGIFAGITDPTLVLHAGETYVFRRISAKHPLALADATLSVSGGDGDHARTSADPSVLAAAILAPRDAFTADPAPTTDVVSWTPTADGTFWYICDIPAHVAMTGKVIVVGGPLPASATAWSAVKALYH